MSVCVRCGVEYLPEGCLSLSVCLRLSEYIYVKVKIEKVLISSVASCVG